MKLRNKIKFPVYWYTSNTLFIVNEIELIIVQTNLKCYFLDTSHAISSDSWHIGIKYTWNLVYAHYMTINIFKFYKKNKKNQYDLKLQLLKHIFSRIWHYSFIIIISC